ncbi:hypothetical protein VNO77_03168 [Canavalia gladiata]|uniref:Uncharacterized protein n=1 Tax=Canavalia gladiata TaxID=3824 RepID=A0AAN9MU96_CANGL
MAQLMTISIKCDPFALKVDILAQLEEHLGEHEWNRVSPRAAESEGEGPIEAIFVEKVGRKKGDHMPKGRAGLFNMPEKNRCLLGRQVLSEVRKI